MSVTCTREYIPLRFRSAGFSADLSRDVLSQRSRPTSGATAHKTRLRHTRPSLSRNRKKHPRAKRFFLKLTRHVTVTVKYSRELLASRTNCKIPRNFSLLTTIAASADMKKRALRNRMRSFD